MKVLTTFIFTVDFFVVMLNVSSSNLFSTNSFAQLFQLCNSDLLYSCRDGSVSRIQGWSWDEKGLICDGW